MALDIDLSIQQAHWQWQCQARLPSGQITAVCGHSGSGKSTLLRCLAGLQPCIGQIVVDGIPWQGGEHTVPPHLRDAALVFQHPTLLPHKNVGQQLQLARRYRRHNNTLNEEQLITQLALRPLLGQRPDTLSGGEQQRVAAALALLTGARLLLLDEPLTGLDGQSRQQVLNTLLSAQRQQQLTVLYASHDIDEVYHIADQVLLFEDNRVIGQDSLMTSSAEVDSPLHRLFPMASILTARVVRYHPEDGLSELRLASGDTLWTPEAIQHRGDIRLRIPARDVSITLSKSSDSSVLNIVAATVDQIDLEHNAAQGVVRLKIDEQYLLAAISQRSIRALGLQPGQAVYAQIKGTALRYTHHD